jgi:2-amino-4-hydroxy-6-hydroxymethyldihydropteridine diphosphokinase
MKPQHRDVYIAFGANEGNPTGTLHTAIPLLEAVLGPLTALSFLYETRALTLNGEHQPNYVNAALKFNSPLSPIEIIDLLMNVEASLGRSRDSLPRWAPRVIDLDLLFVGDLIEQRQRLILPHPEIAGRDFVLTPLSEIAASFVHPVLGKTIEQLESSLDDRGIERFVLGRITAAPTSAGQDIVA